MFKGLENNLIDFLKTFYDQVGWWGVLVMMAIESMMIPLPSEIIMPLAGWLLVHQGAGNAPVWLQLVLSGFVGGMGCVVGSVLAYWIGLAGGRPLIVKYGKYVLIKAEHLDASERWLARWGTLAIFLSRLLPVVRTFISLPAGVARSPFIRFVVLTFAGSFLWSLGLSWLGFVLGPKFDEVRNSLGGLDYIIAGVIVLLIGWFIYHSLKQRKKDQPQKETV